MARRQRVFDTIRRQFSLFGFQPLETPAMENLSVLTGKYGEEGDRLIYKILNSGQFAEGLTPQDFEGTSGSLAAKLCDRALRYDLTVPFARYVAMNKGQLTLPFRRYQMQPVWRADRPQKGRYREFYQCDADIVGTTSLVCEGELLALLYNVFSELGLDSTISIKLNSRLLLGAMAARLGAEGKMLELTTAIDKLDKIGKEGVEKELAQRGFSPDAIAELSPILGATVTGWQALDTLTTWLATAPGANEGAADLKTIVAHATALGVPAHVLTFDPTLARGLDYYTGAIIEVKALGVSIGSIAGGGRYDNLTAVFGVPDVPGVGISFGIDRICDVLQELNLFGQVRAAATQVVLCALSEAEVHMALQLLGQLRASGVATELHPDIGKLKKGLSYADKLGATFAILIGEDERLANAATVRPLATGKQTQIPIEAVPEYIKLQLALA